MSFFGELRRRNVFRIGAFYIVSCWIVLQVAELLVNAFELPPAWIRLVLALLILGFPVAIALAWFYELTPEGLRRTGHAGSGSPAASRTGRRISILAVVLLAVAVAAVLALDRLLPALRPAPDTASTGALESRATPDTDDDATRSNAQVRKPSIAVLPFANRSARDDDNYFVDGIHDDILTQLARIGSLVVISRTSVERYRNTQESLRDIGAVLGVANILEGSVQRAGDRIRINVQLISVADDAHLWADTYDRELTTENIFAIQSEIAIAIAESLKAALSPAEEGQLDTAPTGNLAALEAYFRGRQAMEARTSTSLKQAEQEFRKAIELDSAYALAYVGLADTLILQAYYGDAALAGQRRLAEPWIERALTLNPRLGEAYISKTEVVDDPAAKEQLYKKGIALAPGYSTGYQWYGEFLVGQGRHEEALEVFREGVRVDPLSNVARFKLGFALEGLGRYDEAGRVYESVVRDNPDFAVGHYLLGQFRWVAEGKLDEAIVSIGRAAAIDPENSQLPAYLAALWSDLGDSETAESWVATARSIPGSGSNAALAAFYMKIAEGDFAGASADAEALLAEIPGTTHAVWALALHDLQESRPERAVARYESEFPGLQEPMTIDDTNYIAAVDLAYVLQATGDDERANPLLVGALAHLADQPRLGNFGYGIADARILAMQGETEPALVRLREAVDDGWRVFWRALLLHDPALASLHTDPKFQGIVDELRADMAAQLEHARKLGAK